MALCDSSEGWDFSKPENHDHPYVLAAPFTTSESLLIALQVFASVIGLVANLYELFILFQHKQKWDKYSSYFPGAYLSGLAIADATYCVFIIYYLVNPWIYSQVSYDASFNYCGLLVAGMMVVSVAAAGFISVIAIETSNDHTRFSRPLTIAAIAVLSVLIVYLAIPTSVYSEDTTKCVHWPQKEVFADFPNQIIPCPWRHFLSFKFVIFHDLPAYYLTAVILIVSYQHLIHPGSGARTGANRSGTPTASNLKARIACHVMCHLISRLVNISGATFVSLTGTTLPVVGSEVGTHILRGTMWLPPVIEPFIYFFFMESYRPLLQQPDNLNPHIE